MQNLLNDIIKVGNELGKLKDKQSFLNSAIEEVLDYEKAWKSVEEAMESPRGQQLINAKLQEQQNKFK